MQGYQPCTHSHADTSQGFPLLSHLILLHLITTVPKLARVKEGAGGAWLETGGGGASLCSEETKQKERHHTNPPYSRFLSFSQNTKIITRASKYAMFEMIFLFVVVA